jgi:hypothetical protein
MPKKIGIKSLIVRFLKNYFQVFLEKASTVQIPDIKKSKGSLNCSK